MKQEALIADVGARVVSRSTFKAGEVSADLVLTEERAGDGYVEKDENVEIRGVMRSTLVVAIADARSLHVVLGKLLESSARRSMRRGKEPPATRDEALAATGEILDILRDKK